ncbi:hypothetical protein BDZ97DRAFT_1760018 [Flammula alnicola]|nr:hypothetical protein BDZ97DRAFT_1760018 [Flammula alnicola]
MPHLRRNFPNSVYFCAAFNFGPDVWTFKHRDIMDLPIAWCTIQAGGSFDPKKGGHFIIWELKLVIEFPPGSLILISSATFTHSNIPVAEGDWRVPFTQFAPGGLFRYVEYGYRTKKVLIEEDPALYEEVCRLRSTRWQTHLGLLSKLDMQE